MMKILFVLLLAAEDISLFLNHACLLIVAPWNITDDYSFTTQTWFNDLAFWFGKKALNIHFHGHPRDVVKTEHPA